VGGGPGEERVGLRGEELSPGRAVPVWGVDAGAYKIVHTVEAAIGWLSPTKSWGLSTRFSASAETADVDKLLQNLLVGVPVDKR
jgi:hypothetical protein